MQLLLVGNGEHAPIVGITVKCPTVRKEQDGGRDWMECSHVFSEQWSCPEGHQEWVESGEPPPVQSDKTEAEPLEETH